MPCLCRLTPPVLRGLFRQVRLPLCRIGWDVFHPQFRHCLAMFGLWHNLRHRTAMFEGQIYARGSIIAWRCLVRNLYLVIAWRCSGGG